MRKFLKEVTSMIDVKKEKTGSMKPIPPFKTLEEEANYWDTHSPFDEMDENTPIIVHRGQKSETLTVRFDPQDLADIRQQADERGLGPTTLVRMWVREHLRRRQHSR
jgi:predicted DNA binding CopG/RHH family protein